MENQNNKNNDESPSYLFNIKDEQQKSNNLYLSHLEINENLSMDISENNNEEKNYLNEISMDSLSSIPDNEDSTINWQIIYEYFKNNYNEFYEELIKEEKNEIPFEKILEECRYLIDIFKEKIKLYNFKDDTIIRCFHDVDNMNQENNNCNCIPIIYKTKYGMVFSCDNKNHKYLGISKIYNKIFQNKLFIKINNIKENQVQTNNNKSENTTKIEFIKVIRYGYEEMQNVYHKNFLIFYNKIIKIIDNDKFNSLVKDYYKNEKQRNEIKRKIKNFHKKLIMNINDYTYFLILKKLIKENFGLSDENNIIENMKLDLENAKKLINFKENKKEDKKFLRLRKQKIRIKWIIHLYYQDEIKNDIDKNIFISISSNEYVCIFLFNIEFLTLNNEQSQYIRLLEKKINKIQNYDDILKIKRCYKRKDVQENHYFLISSFIEEKALIIEVSEKSENPLEQRYQIKEIQLINIERGLYSSIEIEYKGKYYLLNYHKSFDIWYYNEIENKFVSKEIKVSDYISDKNLGNKSLYGPLIQSKNKKLIIALVVFPIQRIEIYNFDESDNFICLKFIGFISLEKDDDFISPFNNDYFLYKDRYLLLTSNVNTKKRKKGGIYIFDLTIKKKINIIEYNDINKFNCLFGLNSNTIICSTELIPIKKTNNLSNKEGGLILISLEEKDGIIILKRIENKTYRGNCNFITCKDFIFKSYFICSSLNENSIFQLKDNNEFAHYFNIYSP